MRVFLVSIVALLLIGCGKQERVVIDNPDDCYVEAVEGGVNLICGGEVTFLPTGGSDGADGQDGADGESCIAEAVDDGVLLTCPGSDPIFIPTHDHDDGDDD